VPKNGCWLKRRRQHVSPMYYLHTKLHDVTSEKTVNIRVAAARISSVDGLNREFTVPWIRTELQSSLFNSYPQQPHFICKVALKRNEREGIERASDKSSNLHMKLIEMRSRLRPFYTNFFISLWMFLRLKKSGHGVCCLRGERVVWEPNFNYLRRNHFLHLCLLEKPIITSGVGQLRPPNKMVQRYCTHRLIWRVCGSFPEYTTCAVSLMDTVCINYWNLIKIFREILFLRSPVEDHYFWSQNIHIHRKPPYDRWTL
jgi:hypothetical protein